MERFGVVRCVGAVHPIFADVVAVGQVEFCGDVEGSARAFGFGHEGSRGLVLDFHDAVALIIFLQVEFHVRLVAFESCDLLFQFGALASRFVLLRHEETAAPEENGITARRAHDEREGAVGGGHFDVERELLVFRCPFGQLIGGDGAIGHQLTVGRIHLIGGAVQRIVNVGLRDSVALEVDTHVPHGFGRAEVEVFHVEHQALIEQARHVLGRDGGFGFGRGAALCAQGERVGPRQQIVDLLRGFARIEVDRAHRRAVERKRQRGRFVERAAFERHLHAARRTAVDIGRRRLHFQRAGRHCFDFHGRGHRLAPVGGGQGVGARSETRELCAFGRHVVAHLRRAACCGREGVAHRTGRRGAFHRHFDLPRRTTRVGVAHDRHLGLDERTRRHRKRARGAGFAVGRGGLHLIVAERQPGEGVRERRIGHRGRLQRRSAGGPLTFFPNFVAQTADAHHFGHIDRHAARTGAAREDGGGDHRKMLHVDGLFPLVGAVFPRSPRRSGGAVGRGAHVQRVAARREVEKERLLVGAARREIAHRHGLLAGAHGVALQLILHARETAHARQAHAHGAARGLAAARRRHHGRGQHIGRGFDVVDDFGQHHAGLLRAAGGRGANVDGVAFVPPVERQHRLAARARRHHRCAPGRAIFRHAVGHGRETRHGVAVNHREASRGVAVAVGGYEGGGEVARVQRRAPLGRHTLWEAEEQHEERNNGRHASAQQGGGGETEGRGKWLFHLDVCEGKGSEAVTATAHFGKLLPQISE